MALTVSTARRNAALDAVLDALNGGFLDIYDGSRPASPDVAVGAQVKLARLAFGNPAFAAAAGGSKSANAITEDGAADASGTATWFRCLTSGGTAVLDGSVGTSGADLILGSVAIQVNAVVQVTSFVVSQP